MEGTSGKLHLTRSRRKCGEGRTDAVRLVARDGAKATPSNDRVFVVDALSLRELCSSLKDPTRSGLSVDFKQLSISQDAIGPSPIEVTVNHSNYRLGESVYIKKGNLSLGSMGVLKYWLWTTSP